MATRSIPGPAKMAVAREPEGTRRWGRIGRVSGYIAGAGFVAGTVLFLFDAVGLLGSGPDYHPTAAGPLQDQANFYVALFAHQHRIVWDIIARDTVLPVAFLALIVLSLAIREIVGRALPEAHLMVAFFLVGGIISILADLTYLGAAEYWRFAGWSAHPPEIMVAVGRSVEAIETLTHWLEASGFAVLAAGLIALGRLCRVSDRLPTRLGPLAYLEALLLVGVAVAGLVPWDTAYQVLSLVTGVVVGPAVVLWLGWHLGGAVIRGTD